MNQPTWWRIPYGQQGVSKADLCKQWLDQALPTGHSGLNRGVILPELVTCAQELLEQDWVSGAVTDALSRGDTEEVAGALNAAKGASRREWLSQPLGPEMTAALIEYYAWPLAKLVCLAGADALKRVKEEAKAQGCVFSKATHDDLKNRAPRFARKRLIANGSLADEERFAALYEPGASPYHELVNSVIKALYDELEFSTAATARKPRALSKAEAKRLLASAEAGPRWLKINDLADAAGLQAFLKALHREPDDIIHDAINSAVMEVTVHTLKNPDWGSEADVRAASGSLKRFGRWRLLDLLRKRGKRREDPLDLEGRPGDPYDV